MGHRDRLLLAIALSFPFYFFIFIFHSHSFSRLLIIKFPGFSRLNFVSIVRQDF